MALALMHFAVPILAGYGLMAIFKLREVSKGGIPKALKMFFIFSASFLGLGLVFIALFKSSYMSAMSNSKQFTQLAQQANPSIMADIQNFVWTGMVTDWLVGGFILLIAAVLFYLFVNDKISKTILVVSILVLFAFDLWRVDYRRMDIAEESINEEVFQRKSEVYNYIKQDNGIYRVADFSSNPANIPAYFLMENINGYHAAKLRVYQDILDVAQPEGFAGSTSQLFNPFLWNLMNVKYIITNRPFGEGMQPIFQSQLSGDLVYTNPTGLPRAFFVNSYEKAGQMDILKHLKDGDFNPLEKVYLEENLKQAIEPVDSTAAARIVEKKNEYIKIDATASGNNFLFISEVYYPVGWKAYIDGKETPIIKSNFGFRGVIVPKGQHTVEMKFTSEGFESGKSLSMILNGVVLLAFAAGLFLEFKKKKMKQNESNEAQEE